MTTKAEQRHAQILSARAYVATRFFPPLPMEYGDLIVRAAEKQERGDTSKIRIPADLNPQPRDVERGLIDSADLLRIVRLQHLICYCDEPDIYDGYADCEVHG